MRVRFLPANEENRIIMARSRNGSFADPGNRGSRHQNAAGPRNGNGRNARVPARNLRRPLLAAGAAPGAPGQGLARALAGTSPRPGAPAANVATGPAGFAGAGARPGLAPPDAGAQVGRARAAALRQRGEQTAERARLSGQQQRSRLSCARSRTASMRAAAGCGADLPRARCSARPRGALTMYASQMPGTVNPIAFGASPANPSGTGAPALGTMLPAGTTAGPGALPASAMPMLPIGAPGGMPPGGMPPAAAGAMPGAGAAPGISPLAMTLASLGGGAVGPRAATAAALPLNQQAAAVGLLPQPGQQAGLLPPTGGPGTPSGGGSMSPTDLTQTLVGGNIF
jgi:hypothetical protein